LKFFQKKLAFITTYGIIDNVPIKGNKKYIKKLSCNGKRNQKTVFSLRLISRISDYRGEGK